MFSALIAQSDNTRTFYELSRYFTMEPWQWAVVVLISIFALALMVFMYLKDSVELPTGITATLLVLRLLAFIGLLVFFMDLEKRSETKIVKNSRAVVLIDTSQSMGIRDFESDLATAGDSSVPTQTSRVQRVVNALGKGDFVNDLRAKHDVVLYGFDGEVRPTELAVFKKIEAPREEQAAVGERRLDEAIRFGRRALGAAGVMLLCSLLLGLTFSSSTNPELRSWLLFGSIMLLFGAAVTTAVGTLGSSEIPFAYLINLTPKWLFRIGLVVGPALLALGMIVGLLSLFVKDPKFHGWLMLLFVVFLASGAVVTGTAASNWRAGLGEDEPLVAETETEVEEEAEEGDEEKPLEPKDVKWADLLIPDGGETRIGETMRWLVNRERGGPIAGIVLFSDGGNNAGIAPSDAARMAAEAGIPVYPVGLGSVETPKQLRAVDLYAPKRVYPGDSFTVTGSLQGFGYEGSTVKISLHSAPLVDGAPGSETQEGESVLVKIGEDGQVLSHRFEIEPKAQGERLYTFRVEPPPGAEIAEEDREKLIKTANVLVVERKNKVLIIAGGPSREYRFLRNQLYRDKGVTLHVWLQSGQEGISQESDELLTEFPSKPEELFEYDCIVAFDPNWLEFSESDAMLLEKWVGEKAGGLICIAGPVNTPEWSNLGRGNTAVDIIKGLYPVVFFNRGSATLRLGRFGAEEAWPLTFTRDGREAEFLWVEDDAVDNEAAWTDFEGVYGYYSVRDPKPGARIFARFSDPDTEIDGELPIYLAGHFYGAGRVFFQASGEMWRVRAVDDAYFERYYTKLIRWAGERRLLRDSSRGVLLVDPERCSRGQQVTVQAKLNDAQFEPLKDPEVTAILLMPDGKTSTLTLRQIQESGSGGMYSGQFTALQEGDYRVDLPVPDSDEVLSAKVRVIVTDLETRNPQRNDADLKDVALKTGGEYYIGVDAAVGSETEELPSISTVMKPQDLEDHEEATPDADFEKSLMLWLLGLIAGVLSVEWIVRRLNKLA